MIRWILVAVAAMTPWQMYVVNTPVGTVSLVQLSLGLFPLLFLSRGLLRPTESIVPVNPPFILLAVFCGLLAAAVIWSPDRVGAAKTLFKVASILIIATAIGLASSATRRRVIVALSLSSTIVALAVIAFRLIPALEPGFLLTPVARLVVDPDILGGLIAGTQGANVLGRDKAGAVFTNANVASLFFGVVMFLTLSVKLPRGLATVTSAVYLAAILATGSKAGLAALIVTGSAWSVAWVWERRTLKRVTLVSGATILAAIGLLVFIAATEVWRTVEFSAVSRLEIWGLALGKLLQEPLIGLGFGGWEQWIWSARPFEGLFIPYPIHNLFLIAWSWAGIGAAVLVAGFAATAVAAPWRGRSRNRGLNDRMQRVALSLAFLWFIIQSLFTNAALTDIRIGIPIGIALGMLSRIRGDHR